MVRTEPAERFFCIATRIPPIAPLAIVCRRSTTG
jgi:hypothetical protein